MHAPLACSTFIKKSLRTSSFHALMRAANMRKECRSMRRYESHIRESRLLVDFLEVEEKRIAEDGSGNSQELGKK